MGGASVKLNGNIIQRGRVDEKWKGPISKDINKTLNITATGFVCGDPELNSAMLCIHKLVTLCQMGFLTMLQLF